jgi:hypothetical protein
MALASRAAADQHHLVPAGAQARERHVHLGEIEPHPSACRRAAVVPLADAERRERRCRPSWRCSRWRRGARSASRSRALGQALARHGERELEDGEHEARPLESVRGKDVYVVPSLCGEPGASVNDKPCRLLFFVAALRDASAARLTVIAPYPCYARKEAAVGQAGFRGAGAGRARHPRHVEVRPGQTTTLIVDLTGQR